MKKRSQKIVLFIEPQKKYNTPTKIGNLFMNRFAIDEDQSNEILKILELKNTMDEGLGLFLLNVNIRY